MAAAASVGGSPRVAPHFPFVPKACVKASEPFFECFTRESEQPVPGGDKDAARRGLAKCVEQMAVYDACVEKVLAKTGPRVFRAPEAYR